MMSGKYVTSCLACTVRNNLVLMVEQASGYWAGRWILPGGKLELGESLEDCAARECFEETRVNVAVSRQVKAFDSARLVLQSRLWIVSSGSIVMSFRGLLMPSASA